jgi:hypothetical protein
MVGHITFAEIEGGPGDGSIIFVLTFVGHLMGNGEVAVRLTLMAGCPDPEAMGQHGAAGEADAG